MRHIFYGIQDLKRHILLHIIFMILVMDISGSFVSRLAAFSNSYIPYSRVMSLKDDSLFFLATRAGEKNIPEKVNAMAADLIRNDKAVIMYSYTGPEVNSYFVYIIGNPHELLSVPFDPQLKTPYAYAGSKTSLHEGDFISSGDNTAIQIPVTKRMPKGAWCFNGNGIETVTLDQYTVIFLSLEDYLMNYWHNELTQQIYLRGCEFEKIRTLILTCQEGGYDTRGDSLRALADNRFPESDRRSMALISLLFVTSGSFLVLILAAVMFMITETNLKAYLVHLIYGGRPIHIFIRSLTSSLILVTLPMCVYPMRFMMNGNGFLLEWDMLGGWYMKTYLVSAAVCLIISLYTVFRFVRNDYASFIHVKE